MENLSSYDFPNIGPLLGGSPQRAIYVYVYVYIVVKIQK